MKNKEQPLGTPVNTVGEKLPHLTKSDLEHYLDYISVAIRKYKVKQGNSNFNDKEIKELNRMAEYAIYRYYHPETDLRFDPKLGQ